MPSIERRADLPSYVPGKRLARLLVLVSPAALFCEPRLLCLSVRPQSGAEICEPGRVCRCCNLENNVICMLAQFVCLHVPLVVVLQVLTVEAELWAHYSQ